MSEYVIGFGDNKVDYYLNQNRKYPGGNAVNFAVAGRQNDLAAYYVGSIPTDADGELILSALKQKGVDSSFCERITTPSEKVFVKVKDGDRIFIDSQRGARQTPELSEELLKLCQNSLLLHTGCHANTEHKLSQLKEVGTKISFDFSDLAKYRTDEYLGRVCPQILIAQFSVAKDDEAEIQRLIARCSALGVSYILLTKGNESPLFIDCTNQQTYQGFIRKADSVRDTMGAGDTYFASFAIHLMLKLKVGPLTESDLIDCFKAAADQAYATLQIDGAFGCGVAIE